MSRNLRCLLVLIAVAITTISTPRAQSNNPCDEPGEYPDVIVADITSAVKMGTVGDITAFSCGVTSCNLGSCWANWFANNSEHPVVAQNMFRLANGRFEHVGQSWVRHQFFALSSAYCSSSCIGSDGSHLGVNCSNTDSASSESYQFRLGPKSEVNPSAGTFPFPATGMGTGGNQVYKRLQVHNQDLDPQYHPGARYWVEVQFVTRDDAQAGNHHNNVSFRPVNVIGTGGNVNIAVTGSTVRAQPAIEAWKAIDPDVNLTNASSPGGRFVVGSRVTATANGYHYEYAIQNVNSHRAAGTFTVPIPTGAVVTDIGFHDVDYHSGELISGADWTATVTDDAIVWVTEPFAVNPDANALRWGTLYNFRFDSPVAPFAGQAEIGLFRPGVPDQIAADAMVPCHGTDSDVDSHWSSCDCDDGNDQAWGVPGEVPSVIVTKDGLSGTVLSWSAPAILGAATITYDVLRTSDPSDFVTAVTCPPTADPSSLTRTDSEDPVPGGLFAYLVRAANACPQAGPLGTDSSGTSRPGGTCP